MAVAIEVDPLVPELSSLKRSIARGGSDEDGVRGAGAMLYVSSDIAT